MSCLSHEAILALELNNLILVEQYWGLGLNILQIQVDSEKQSKNKRGKDYIRLSYGLNNRKMSLDYLSRVVTFSALKFCFGQYNMLFPHILAQYPTLILT